MLIILIVVIICGCICIMCVCVYIYICISNVSNICSLLYVSFTSIRLFIFSISIWQMEIKAQERDLSWRQRNQCQSSLKPWVWVNAEEGNENKILCFQH